MGGRYERNGIAAVLAGTALLAVLSTPVLGNRLCEQRSSVRGLIVPDDVAISPTIVKDGAVFAALATPRWLLSTNDAVKPVWIALRVTNAGSASVRFNLFDTVRIGLTAADGRKLLLDGGRDATRAATFVTDPVSPGASVLVERQARLIRLGSSMRLIGCDPFGTVWYFDGIGPGRFTLSIEYTNDRSKVGPHENVWKGVVVTPPVSITVERP